MANQALKQFLSFWEKLPRSQRIALIGLVLLAAIMIPVLVTWASTPSYAVAFNNLSEEDAGLIVEALTEAGINYELRDASTIMVPSEQVYEVRLMMAKEGLPEGGTVGYELFSGNTLGMTEFTQRVTYQRALEGELERTIGTIEAVEMVRVHIVQPEERLLAEDESPATASVTVKERPGQHLDLAQVRAITHLVASSVEDIEPENVVVVDVAGNLLTAGLFDDQTSISVADKHQAAEQAAAAALKSKVEDILVQALGPNRSVVQAYVTMDWTERETTVQSFDPQQAAIRSSQVVSETYQTNGAITGGVPGADTNLPPLTDTTLEEGDASDYQRYEEITNYEVTQTQTHEIVAPGTVERVSVSVLVDGVTDAQALQALETVIAAAAGIDVDRGDLLAVESLAFDRSYVDTQTAEMEADEMMDLYMRVGQVAGAVAIVILAIWYVNRLLSRLRKQTAQNWVPVLKPAADLALPGAVSAYQLGQTTLPSLPQAEPVLDPVMAVLAERAAEMATIEQALKPESAVESKPMPKPIRYRRPEPEPEEDEEEEELPLEPTGPSVSRKEERLIKAVTQLAEQDPSRIAEIISLWLSENKR